jgi:Clathrin propeller repeat
MAPVHVGQSCGADDDADSCQWTGRFAFLSALALHRWRPDWRANCLCFLRLNTGTRRAPLTLPCSQLPSIGVAQEFISFKNTTMESEKYVCIRETGATNQVVIVDMASPLSPSRRQITADSALMCPDKKVIALKAATPGTPGDALQVFNLDTKTKLRAHQVRVMCARCTLSAAAV